MIKKRIVFFTAAWWDHVKMYEDITFPSMEDDLRRLEEEGYELEVYKAGFNTKELPEVNYAIAVSKPNMIMLPHLRECLQMCLDKNALLFLAPPDTIWGKGSIYNSVKMMEGKTECLAIPHIRISKDDYPNKAPTNRELVNMCFDYPHDAFMESFDTIEKNGTWAGLSARKITKDIYTVIHNMPTVYLVNVTALDIQFWNQVRDFGEWDRAWLNLLFQNNRVKIASNSDVAFCAEITKEESNVPPNQNKLLYNDKHFIQGLANHWFNKFVYTLMR